MFSHTTKVYRYCILQGQLRLKSLLLRAVEFDTSRDMPDYCISVFGSNCLVGDTIDLVIDVACMGPEVETQEGPPPQAISLSLKSSDDPTKSRLQHETALSAQSGSGKASKMVTFDLNNLNVKSKRLPILSSIEHDAADRLSILMARVYGGFVLDKTICGDSFSHLTDLHHYNVASGGGLTLHEKDRGMWFFDGLRNALMGTAQMAQNSEQSRASKLGLLPIFILPPTILAVDMKMRLEQYETFKLMLNLPANLPPTFLGTFVQFTYTLELTLQRINGQSRTLEIQLPITNNSTHSDYDFTQPYILHNSVSQGLAVSIPAPSAQVPVHNHSDQDDFEQYLQLLHDHEMSRPSRPFTHPGHLAASGSEELDFAHKYDLAQENKHLGIVSLSKTRFKPGDVISGSLLFPNSILRCSRYFISLESTEVMNEQYISNTTCGNGKAHRKVGVPVLYQCAFLQRSQFELLIPVAIVPTFKTHLVNLEYSLFLTITTRGEHSRAVETRTRHGIESTPPLATSEEKFDCRIPITIIHPGHQDFRAERNCKF